jgi:hypothetical protein
MDRPPVPTAPASITGAAGARGAAGDRDLEGDDYGGRDREQDRVGRGAEGVLLAQQHEPVGLSQGAGNAENATG